MQRKGEEKKEIAKVIIRLFLSRTYLECKTINLPRARTMHWGTRGILFVHDNDLAGLFLSVEYSSDLTGGRAGSCSFTVPLGFLLKLKVRMIRVGFLHLKEMKFG